MNFDYILLRKIGRKLSTAEAMANVLFRNVLPVEIVATISASMALCISFLFDLHFYYPNRETALFIWRHYLGPLTPALIIAIFFLLLKRQLKPVIFFKAILRQIRLFASFFIIIFFHFNYKLWAQLINPNRLDGFYYQIDRNLSPVLSLLTTLRKLFTFLPNESNAYHDLFVSMFVFSFLIHAFKRGFLELITATAIVLTLGGVAYSIAPALGPFIYEKGPNPIITSIQEHMLSVYSTFLNSNGLHYQGRDFVSAVAAMPSLHVANAVVFIFFAIRYAPWLTILYVPICFFIIVEAVVCKWHYLIDIPFGIVVALVSSYLSLKLCRDKAAREDLKMDGGKDGALP